MPFPDLRIDRGRVGGVPGGGGNWWDSILNLPGGPTYGQPGGGNTGGIGIGGISTYEGYAEGMAMYSPGQPVMSREEWNRQTTQRQNQLDMIAKGWDPNFPPWEGGPDPNGAYAPQPLTMQNNPFVQGNRVSSGVPRTPTSTTTTQRDVVPQSNIPTTPRGSYRTPIIRSDTGLPDTIENQNDEGFPESFLRGITGRDRDQSWGNWAGGAAAGVGGGLLAYYLSGRDRNRRRGLEDAQLEMIQQQLAAEEEQREQQRQYREALMPLLNPAIGRLQTQLSTPREPTNININPFEDYSGPLLARR